MQKADAAPRRLDDVTYKAYALPTTISSRSIVTNCSSTIDQGSFGSLTSDQQEFVMPRGTFPKSPLSGIISFASSSE